MNDWSLLPAFFRDPLRTLGEVSQRGDVVPVRIGFRTLWVLSHPEVIGEALLENHGSFKKGALLGAVRVVLGDGLLTAQGDDHVQQRRRLAGAFTRKALARHREALEAVTQRHLESWQPGERDLEADMGALTLSLVCRVVLGLDADEVAPELREAVEMIAKDLPATVAAAKLGAWTPRLRRAKAAVQRLDTFVREVLSEREPQGELVDHLIRSEPDPKRLRDQVLTLIVTGHETVAHALAWAGWELANHPDVQQRLLDADDAYAERVFQEALRQSPPGWAFTKRVGVPCTLGGHALGVGDYIMIPAWHLHRDPRFWEHPERFHPDRFFNQPSHRFAYLPFSHGPRSCIAAGLGVLEGTVVLRALCARWRLSPVPGKRPELLPRYTMKLRSGCPVQVSLR